MWEIDGVTPKLAATRGNLSVTSWEFKIQATYKLFEIKRNVFSSTYNFRHRVQAYYLAELPTTAILILSSCRHDETPRNTTLKRTVSFCEPAGKIILARTRKWCTNPLKTSKGTDTVCPRRFFHTSDVGCAQALPRRNHNRSCPPLLTDTFARPSRMLTVEAGDDKLIQKFTRVGGGQESDARAWFWHSDFLMT